LTTKASFIMLEIYEYLKGPAGSIQSFLILPELTKAISELVNNLIKSAKKFPYAV
jgi:hypothetical protein